MTLTAEGKRRIDRWREELPRHFYRALGAVNMAGFTTTAQLTAEEAHRHTFHPTPPGTRWGAKWEYGWFRGEVVLPEEGKGRRIVLSVDVGAESIVFICGGHFLGGRGQALRRVLHRRGDYRCHA